LFHGTQPHEKRLDAIYEKRLDRSFPVRSLGKAALSSPRMSRPMIGVVDGVEDDRGIPATHLGALN